jgi:hypothetical protein
VTAETPSSSPPPPTTSVVVTDDEKPEFVGNKAFESFKCTMPKKTNKGVATQGQGRANAYAEKTKQGWMQPV